MMFLYLRLKFFLRQVVYTLLICGAGIVLQCSIAKISEFLVEKSLQSS